MAGALSGIRVVELASYVSGPYASMILADYGAEIVKVESPDGGDPFRAWGAGAMNPFFDSVNRNKKSVVADLKTARGRADIRGLIARSDVVVENYRTGVLDRYGLGYDSLRAENPRLIYCSITGFGNFGPYANRPGYDTIGQAMSGMLSLLTDQGNPKAMGVSISDHLAGMVACNAILAALYARERSGLGQRVDTSLIESTLSFVGENATRYLNAGQVSSRATRTYSAQVFAFSAGDGLPFVIHLSSPKKFWVGLLRAIDRPQWGGDPRFAQRTDRIANYTELEQELAAVFATGARAQWLDALQREDVPSAAIYDMKEVFSDEQVKALGMQVRLEHPERGEVSYIRNGARMSATPTEIHSPAPVLGSDTDAYFASETDAPAEHCR